ncbi:MAG: FG-GAP repeat-containing protein, partial [bacterium]
MGHQIFAGDIGSNLFNKALMVADLDDDGDIDLSLPGPYGELWVFPNPGNGLFGSPIVVPVRGFVTGLALADADDQPGQELYVLCYEPGLIQSFHLDRNGLVHPLRVQESIGRSDRQTLADLNGDCVVDFLLQVGSDDRVTIQYGSGQGVFGAPVFERMGRPLAWATAGDTDQDGRDDLIAYALGPGILQVRRGVPGGLGEIEEFAVGGALREYVLADIDDDGRLDLVGTSSNSSDVLIIWNEGDPLIPSVPPAPAHIQLV